MAKIGILKNPNTTNSYICTTKDNAMAQAANIDKLIQNDAILPPLAGMPIAIKDIFVQGVATTCASEMLKALFQL